MNIRIKDFVIKKFDFLETISLLLFVSSLLMLIKEIKSATTMVIISSIILSVLYWFKVTDRPNNLKLLQLVNYKIVWYSFLFLPICFYAKISLNKNADYLLIINLILATFGFFFIIYLRLIKQIPIIKNLLVRSLISTLTNLIIFLLPTIK